MPSQIKQIIKNSGQIFNRPHRNVFSAAIVVAFTYGISMLLGIWRERLIVGRFYNCCRAELDAYYAAFRLPDMIFQLVVIGALSAAFIPVFTRLINRSNSDSNDMASSVLNSLLLVFFFFSSIIFIWAKPFSSLITGNFSYSQINQMAAMTRLMLAAQGLFLISNFMAAIIQSHRRFLLPSLAPVVYNLGIIFVVWFFSGSLGIWSTAIGVVVGALFHLLIQIPLVYRLGFRYRPIINWKNKNLTEVGRLMLPRTISLAAGQIESTVSLFIATSLSVGSLTLYYLANKLADLPVRIIGTSIGQAALPLMTSQRNDDKLAEFKQTLTDSLSMLFYLAFPATGFFLVLRLQLVRLAYGSGAFPWQATITTGQVMAVIVLSIFSQSAIQLIVRAYYSVSDTKTPLYAGLVSVFVNLFLSLLLTRYFDWGVLGLAVAFTVANSINFIYLFIYFHYHHERFIDKTIFSLWFKMLQASVVAATISWLSMRLFDRLIFDTTRVVDLIVLTATCLLIGLIVYYLLSLLMQIKQASLMLSVIHRVNHLKQIMLTPEPIQETPKIDQ